MSQAELAEAAEISVQFVAALEQQSRAASLKSLDRLAKALGVPTSRLFEAGEGRPGGRSTARDQLAALLDGLTKRQQGHIISAVREMRKLIPRRGR